jgi:RNA polymerase sigma factor (sigma-70 family)
MVLPQLLRRRARADSVSNVLEIEELDSILDVEIAAFERHCAKLVRRMRLQRNRINVVGYRSRMAVAANTASSSDDVRGSFYHVELRRIPPMTREEEFRMARRYEFLKRRAVAELVEVGVPKEQARDLVLRARSTVERHLAGLARRRDRAYAEACIAEFEQLRNLYVEGSLHIVLGTVNRYRGLGVDVADLIQEGNASLFQAIEGFDWRRDVRFRTYAQYWVHQAVLKMLYNSARTVRVPIWVQKMLGRIRRVQAELRRDGEEPTAAQVGARLGVPAERIEWILATKRYAVSIDAELPDAEGVSMAQSLEDEKSVAVPDSVPEGDLGASLGDAMSSLPPRERMILERRFGLGGREPETLGQIAVGLGITAERVRQLQNAAIGRLKKPSSMQRLQAFAEQI